MEKFKEKLIYFLDRRKHDKRSNLTLACVVVFIFLIIGLFFPIVGIKGNINLKNTGNDTTILQIFNPKESIFEVKSTDFITGKDLKEFAILGTPIGKYSIGKVNVYDLITSPVPELKWLRKTNDTLNSGIIDFLVSNEFKLICDEYLGDFGKGVKELGKTIYDLSNSTSDVLDKIIEVSDQLNKASESVNKTIADINEIIDIVDIVYIVLLLLPVISIVLLIINKGPRKLPAILLTIFTIIFVVFGIGIAVGNSYLQTGVLNAQTSLNDAIHSLIYNLIPGTKDILKSTGIIQNIVFEMNVYIECGLGWWLITIPSIILTVLAYIIPSVDKTKKDKKTSKKKATA